MDDHSFVVNCIAMQESTQPAKLNAAQVSSLFSIKNCIV